MSNKTFFRRLSLFGAGLCLSACSGMSETTLPDGSVAYRISCDSSSAGMNYCFERAGRTCGAEGYTVVDDMGRPLLRAGVSDSDPEALVRSYQMDSNSMLIRCGT